MRGTDIPTVFISYSHDSDEHCQHVLALSERLRADGIETLLDQYVNASPPEGWQRWMMNQLDQAEHVLVVCTETYYRRFLGREEPGSGRGVDWEGVLITSEMYSARSKSLKFVPILLSVYDEEYIPEPLRSATHYAVTSESGYGSLYDFLLQQSGVEPGAIGPVKTKPRAKGSPLSFTALPPGTPPPATSSSAFSSPQTPAVQISRIDKYAPAELVGRADEMQALHGAWAKVRGGEYPRPHVFTFVGLGGEGKTSVVAKWAAKLAEAGWPGCDAAFAWSFYSQGTREQMTASSDLFLRAALTFFGDANTADSGQGPHDKGKRLAELVGNRQALLVLDGVEPLQYPPTSRQRGELKDQGMLALLKGLAAQSRGLCVVTTRYSIPNLKAYWQSTAPEYPLLRLSQDAGGALLRSLGVQGAQSQFERLVDDVKGHALTLTLLGTYLRDAYGGDIRKRNLVGLEEADDEEQGGHAFRVMDAYVRWFKGEGPKGKRAIAVLNLLGLFEGPASAECLALLRRPPAIPNLTQELDGTEAQWNIVVSRLKDAKLLTVHRDRTGAIQSLDTHTLVRAYFAQKLREQHPGAWKTAHERLFQHLCATAEDKIDPTLEDLQPLYQAVAHGCQAGRCQEACDSVFLGRILRGDEAYSTYKLGAVGADLDAAACFFTTPWKSLSPALSAAAQGWLLNEAALRLRILGRLTEAVEPTQAALDMAVTLADWENATGAASNLSQLQLLLGRVGDALEEVQTCVIHAERSRSALSRIISRQAFAHALHQAGRRDEAEARFREAEHVQAQAEPHQPYLYALMGFRYCELLLAEAERAAWASSLGLVPSTGLICDSRAKAELESCTAVAQRTAQTLPISERHRWLYNIALDHLTLGRVALYASILDPRNPQLSLAGSHIGSVVDDLLQAGQYEFVGLGLLARAWLRSLAGATDGADGARADLDEAWDVAERGPMPLLHADIHLYRARLFFREPNYPWQSPQHDLTEARRLIFKHGYLRRKEELEDAETAILEKPGFVHR